MSDLRRVIWLASYPKSGNTWTRVFLANYLMNSDKPVPISEIHRFGLGDSISKMYRMVGGDQFDARDIALTLRLRPHVLRAVVANKADVNFVKTHNRRGDYLGTDLIPAELTRSAIYIIRNPLDTVLSYAKHFNVDLNQATDALCRDDTIAAPNDSSTIQFLSSWATHVTSWTGFATYPICVVRYEDMLTDPEHAFTKMLKLIGIPVDQNRLKKSIRFASFKELKKQEEKQGFEEKPEKSETFFRSGKSGNWKKELPEALRDKIIAANGEVMKKYGYIE